MEETYYNLYPIEVIGHHRQLPIIPLNDGLAIASFVILGDVILTNSCARALADLIQIYRPQVLVTIEAKGIPLVHMVATELDMEGFILIRKGGPKLYMEDPIVVEGKSITTGGTQQFVLNGANGDNLRGKRVAFIDDVISTGGSRDAARELISMAGGIIVCEAFILKEGSWVEDRPNLIYLERLPIFEPAPGGGWRTKG